MNNNYNFKLFLKDYFKVSFKKWLLGPCTRPWYISKCYRFRSMCVSITADRYPTSQQIYKLETNR